MSLMEKESLPQAKTLDLPQLILASASPRRSEILNAVGWKFEKQAADLDETELENENPADYVVRLAREKALAIAGNIENGLILGADTTVVIENEIIGKPKDLADAAEMLGKLSGRWHEVLTGVALVKKNGGKTEIQADLERTKVKFFPLSDSEINYLVERGEPLDKAGAYAVQGAAALFIERIEGDYWNVVGLPVQLVYKLARQF
ncbi:MAG TPA: Maf family protein [Pyrinomonadaceae bacterium]|jgi:septum formation protein